MTGDLSHLPKRAVVPPKEPLSGRPGSLILAVLGSGPLAAQGDIYDGVSWQVMVAGRRAGRRRIRGDAGRGSYDRRGHSSAGGGERGQRVLQCRQRNPIGSPIKNHGQTK